MNSSTNGIVSRGNNVYTLTVPEKVSDRILGIINTTKIRQIAINVLQYYKARREVPC
ncbi:MAG: hypothetical protein AB4063_06645 [Crocosphaera sp.]